MEITAIQLSAAAAIFRVHPRTILRALTGEHNTYWSEDINDQKISVKDLAAAYDISVRDLNVVIDNRDALLTPTESAEVLGIRDRTFRDHLQRGKYHKIQNGGIVRYLRSKMIEAKITRS